MKYLFILIITSAIIFSQQSSLKTLDYVDLKKYAGIWYEVGKIPNRFQSHCVSETTAKYTLRENGEIEVINSCVDKNGKLDKTEGIARVVDKKSNSKLEVSFFSILGWRPIWGDYWIIGLDENYQWAIVGTPSRKYGWILARNPQLDKDTLDKIMNILKEQGYNTKDFEMQ